LNKYLYIAIGGALGSIARFWVSSNVAHRIHSRFPYGTFIVNLSACLLIGFFLSILGRRADLGGHWRMLIPIGFIGAYSTFSTFEWEIFVLTQGRDFFIASAYLALSVFLGLAAVWVGLSIGRAV
jgi:fluoride exporter